MNDAVLDGKVIVVMGGTTGLGLSASLAFVRSGARVVVVGRNPESARKADKLLGQDGKSLQGDATHPRTSSLAIECAIQTFGSFDGLYHVAGGSGRRFGDGPLHEITEEGWGATLRLNLDSVFYSNQAAVKSFLDFKKLGVILNMGSVLGFSPSPHHFSTHAYATCKSALLGLTKSCASYYAAKGIRFNLIVPALVETPMSKRACDDPDIMEFIRRKQPLDGGRVGLPEDLDGMAVLLMSDQARFITGQSFVVDGGWSVTDLG